MITEKKIVGEGGAYPLNACLTLPDDRPAPVPAVVMVHGSGPSDMDEKVMKLRPFRDLAEGLAGHGVASLRYDKRTYAHARRMARTDLTVKEETIDDALLALELLRSDPRIDPDRVFLLGHSMGAMLLPRIDAEGGNAAGLVLMAGTPYRLEDIVLRQLEQAGEGKTLLKGIFRLEHRIYEKKFRALETMSDEEAKKKKFAGSLSLYYFREMGRKTAADYLLESSKPVLILQGEKDFQVLPDVDLEGFREKLAGRENTEYCLYPGLDHCFVESLTGDIRKAAKEYGTERHIGADVIADIAAFVRNSER